MMTENVSTPRFDTLHFCFVVSSLQSHRLSNAILFEITLVGFFFLALRLELYEVHKKSVWLRGNAAQPLGYGKGACLLPWESGEWIGVWLWLDEAVWGPRTGGWRVGCGGGIGGDGNEPPDEACIGGWVLACQGVVEADELSWFIKCGNGFGPPKKRRRMEGMAFVLGLDHGYGTLGSINAKDEPYFEGGLV